jgi:peptidoglycan hydrolase-like protein with peptidoglycan-binding domain
MTRAATFKAEVLLDRLDISPGIIDGKTGENVGKAIAAFQRPRGLAASGKLDRTTWDKLCESTNAPALLAGLVRDGLATARREPVKVDGRMVRVACLRSTNAGRSAIEDRALQAR